MNEFAEHLFELAYQSRQRLQRRRGDIPVRDLVDAVELHWVTYRDGATD